MKLPIYQIDAFAEALFRGNPAAVIPLDKWLPDQMLQTIAGENNLSETVYFVASNETGIDYDIRWFTPAVEVDLCGHATLAAAWVLFQRLNFSAEQICFGSASGPLRVSRDDDYLWLDFPVTELIQHSDTTALEQALGCPVETLLQAGPDLMAVLKTEAQLQQLQPDFNALAALGGRGIIVTAAGEQGDFVSRFYAPAAGINEDPVTGSAHCALTPYWSQRLGKQQLIAQQVSARRGHLICRLEGDRVAIGGQCFPYLEGMIQLD